MKESNWGGKREGAGRKPTGKRTKNLTVTLPDYQIEAIKERASEKGLTPSKYIAQCCKVDTPFYNIDESFSFMVAES